MKKRIKKSNLIPQYLQDELSNLVQQKDTYTKEEILKRKSISYAGTMTMSESKENS